MSRLIKLSAALCATIFLSISTYSYASERIVRFADVDPATTSGAAIYQMTSLGVINSVTPDKFEPDAPISAVDYITMLCKLRHLSPLPAANGIPGNMYMNAALQAGWYSWDEIPPDQPGRLDEPVSREVAANILIKAFFGGVQYDWNEHYRISDFAEVSGRYYEGVLGGLTLGLFNQRDGWPFRPRQPLSRADACIWASNALAKIGDRPAASQPSVPSTAPSVSGPAEVISGVAENGWLEVRGTQLCNERGTPVVLHGMSSMGIQWYPQYTNLQSIRNTVDRGANVFRIAVYVEEGGYVTDPARFTSLVESIVENAVRCNIYVIIDWHILSDGNPMSHLSDALTFFTTVSAKYRDTPNVIYEICNEPNGNVSWSRDIKPYAESVIAAIRENAPRNIILVGSPNWSQDVDVAAADQLSHSNVMYALHFYAGTHGQELRDKATRALELGAPVFVSEWGTSNADGSGGIYIQSSNEWLDYMAERSISWCNWSLCDKNESSAALLPGAPCDAVWTSADLSESGNYVFARFGSQVPAPSRPSAVPVTAAEAAKQFGIVPGCTTIVYDGDDPLATDDIVCTGYRIACVNDSTGGVEKEDATVVFGDVLGTGRITLSQIVRMAAALTGANPLEGPFAIAADLDGSTKLGVTDLVAESRLFTSGGTLRCSFVKQH